MPTVRADARADHQAKGTGNVTDEEDLKREKQFCVDMMKRLVAKKVEAGRLRARVDELNADNAYLRMRLKATSDSENKARNEAADLRKR